MKITDILDEQKINTLIQKTKVPSKAKVAEILEKAKAKKGLSLEDSSHLLNVEDRDLLEEIFAVARQIKWDIYGERVVFFAPLYISNFCVNNCKYCSFHSDNKMQRRKLTMEEIQEQTKFLIDSGHKRALLEYGEHPTECNIDYIVDSIKAVYATKSKNGEIRRANINFAATTVENYKKVKEVGIGTYQLFQETYHRETYEHMHKGLKGDYERQLFAHDRAFEAGIDDVGIGVLYGLYDYKFDTIALLSHADYLDRTYGVGPHTISVPRFQDADTVNTELKHKISPETLLKIIAIIRLSVPYTGMIISTRETPETRKRALELGISQTSAGSRTTIGGYTAKDDGKPEECTQFHLSDHRNLAQVIEGTLEQGLLPSFCTACYRTNRTGHNFMEIAKPGDIQTLCRPNGILTLKEYLEDYADEEVKKLGEGIIAKYFEKIEGEALKKATAEKLRLIEDGHRDLYF